MKINSTQSNDVFLNFKDIMDKKRKIALAKTTLPGESAATKILKVPLDATKAVGGAGKAALGKGWDFLKGSSVAIAKFGLVGSLLAAGGFGIYHFFIRDKTKRNMENITEALNNSRYTFIYLEIIESISGNLQGYQGMIEGFLNELSNAAKNPALTKTVNDLKFFIDGLASTNYASDLGFFLEDVKKGILGDLSSAVEDIGGFGQIIKNPLDNLMKGLDYVGQGALFRDKISEYLSESEVDFFEDSSGYLLALTRLIDQIEKIEDPDVIEFINQNENLLRIMIDIGEQIVEASEILRYILGKAGIAKRVTDDDLREELRRDMASQKIAEENIFIPGLGSPDYSGILLQDCVIKSCHSGSSITFDIPLYVPMVNGVQLISNALKKFLTKEVNKALDMCNRDSSILNLREEFNNIGYTSQLSSSLTKYVQDIRIARGDDVARNLEGSFHLFLSFRDYLPKEADQSMATCLQNIVSMAIRNKLNFVFYEDHGWFSSLNKIKNHMEGIADRKERIKSLGNSENNLIKNNNSINNEGKNMKNKKSFSDQLKKDAILGRQPDQPLSEFYKALGQEYGNDIVPRDTRENLYGHQGEDLVLRSHPKKVIVSDSIKDGGLVENGHEQKEKSLQVAKKNPTGNFVGNYAWMRDYIKKQS